MLAQAMVSKETLKRRLIETQQMLNKAITRLVLLEQNVQELRDELLIPTRKANRPASMDGPTKPTV
jgi:hypothetical protein